MLSQSDEDDNKQQKPLDKNVYYQQNRKIVIEPKPQTAEEKNADDLVEPVERQAASEQLVPEVYAGSKKNG